LVLVVWISTNEPIKSNVTLTDLNKQFRSRAGLGCETANARATFNGKNTKIAGYICP